MLSSPGIEAAFHAVAREHFLSDTLSDGGLAAVYRDDAIITKRTAQGLPLSSSSQPAIMAKMLELLGVQPGDQVLEIGAGTGYNAALLAYLTGSSGRVTSIDIDKDIAAQARRALHDSGARATIVAGDGRDGYQAHAPYDRIIATASADEIPRAWLEQLRDGGRLVMPLRLDPDGGAVQLIPALERRGTTLRSVGMTWGGFMPLHNGDGGHQRPLANLSIVHSVDERHSGLVSLSGAGIAQLTQSAARDLLVSLLSKPRTPRRRGITDLNGRLPPLLLIYLLLNIPANDRFSLRHAGRWGIGLVDRNSTATVSLRSPWNQDSDDPGRARWRLDAYGPNHAATKLEQLLDQWQQLERAHQTTLHISASGYDRTLQLSFTWENSGWD
jgi:protein-L-isoaspartate(D-aspartate) O-methyltransferase